MLAQGEWVCRLSTRLFTLKRGCARRGSLQFHSIVCIFADTSPSTRIWRTCGGMLPGPRAHHMDGRPGACRAGRGRRK